MNVKTQIEKFNSDNLTSAIETCYEKPFYRVLIVAPKMVRTTGLIVIDCVSKLYPHERSELKKATEFNRKMEINLKIKRLEKEKTEVITNGT